MSYYFTTISCHGILALGWEIEDGLLYPIPLVIYAKHGRSFEGSAGCAFKNLSYIKYGRTDGRTDGREDLMNGGWRE